MTTATFAMATCEPCTVLSFDGQDDGVNRHYQFDIALISKEKLPSHGAGYLHLQNTLGYRYWHGIITARYYDGYKAPYFYYRLVLQSPLHILSTEQKSNNFCWQTSNNIIETCLYHYPNLQTKYHWTKKQIQQKHIAQYKKSDLQFLQALCYEQDYYFILKQQKQHPSLHFCDSASTLTDLTKISAIKTIPYTTGINNKATIFELSDQTNWHQHNTIAYSNLPTLEPGQCIHIDKKILRLSNIAHHFNQHQQYKNTLSCQDLNTDIEIPKQTRQCTHTVTAKTTKKNEETLNKQGHYYLQFTYDPKTKTAALPRLQDSASANHQQTYGTHFPLAEQINCLVGFVENAVDQAIIIGHLPNTASPSIVNNKNPQQHLLKTNNTTLAMDDKAASIKLHTNNEHALFTLSKQQGVQLQHQTGNWHCQSGHKIHINAGKHYYLNIKQTYNNTQINDRQLLVIQGDMQHHSGNNIHISAYHTAKLQAHSIKLQTHQSFTHQAEKTFYAKSSNGNITINTKQSIQLQAQTGITACALDILQLGDTFGMTLRNNSITIHAKQLTLNATTLNINQRTDLNP